MRSVEEQSFTVCASHALTWCNREGQTQKVMTARQSAILMGFGNNWRLPTGSRSAQRVVGNALCVIMSKAIVQAAISLQTGTPIPTPPPPEKPAPEPALAIATSQTKDADHGLHKRLRTIETLIGERRDYPPLPSGRVSPCAARD